jgi:hypothetical protein
MNGFQIGNKRLKVQHKRVHSGGGDSSQQQDQQTGDLDAPFPPTQPEQHEDQGAVPTTTTTEHQQQQPLPVNP